MGPINQLLTRIYSFVSKAFMVGGIGTDWMAGGSQADLLIGNPAGWAIPRQ